MGQIHMRPALYAAIIAAVCLLLGAAGYARAEGDEPVGGTPPGGEPTPTEPTPTEPTPTEPTPTEPTPTVPPPTGEPNPGTGVPPTTPIPTPVETPTTPTTPPRSPVITTPSASGGSSGGNVSPTPAATPPATPAELTTPIRATDHSPSAGGGSGGSRHSAPPDPSDPAQSVAQAPASPGASSPEPAAGPADKFGESGDAASHVAANVADIVSEAVPADQLRELGTRIGVSAGLIPGRSGIAQRTAVDRIGKAFGAALLGSAVAANRDPGFDSHPSILPLEPAAGGARTLYLILVWAMVLGLLTFVAIQILANTSGKSAGTWLRQRGQALGRLTLAGLRESAGTRVEDSIERASKAVRRLRASAAASLSSLRSLL